MDGILYALEVRRFEQVPDIDFKETDLANIVTSPQIAKMWIEKNGMDWDQRDYYFTASSMLLNCAEHQPVDELYYFDKFGNQYEDYQELLESLEPDEKLKEQATIGKKKDKTVVDSRPEAQVMHWNFPPLRSEIVDQIHKHFDGSNFRFSFIETYHDLWYLEYVVTRSEGDTSRVACVVTRDDEIRFQTVVLNEGDAVLNDDLARDYALIRLSFMRPDDEHVETLIEAKPGGNYLLKYSVRTTNGGKFPMSVWIEEGVIAAKNAF